MCWFKSRFRHKKIPTKLLTATEERAQMEDKSIIHSADGLWTIRLTKAIKNAVTKIPGSSVAVWEAKLLKSPSEATEGDTEEAGDTEGAGEDTEEAEEATSSDGSFSPGLPSPTLHPDAIDSEEETEEDNGQTFIVKIFKVGPEGDGNRSTTEIAALETLTEAECAHAPTYLGHFENDLSPGVVRYVLMTKLPGYNLEDNSTWKLNPATVKEAFTIAIRDVHSHGVNNGSPVLRNVMWDPVGGKCYIVDFERAILGNLDDFSEDWSFFGRIKL